MKLVANINQEVDDAGNNGDGYDGYYTTTTTTIYILLCSLIFVFSSLLRRLFFHIYFFFILAIKGFLFVIKILTICLSQVGYIMPLMQQAVTKKKKKGRKG